MLNLYDNSGHIKIVAVVNKLVKVILLSQVIMILRIRFVIKVLTILEEKYDNLIK